MFVILPQTVIMKFRTLMILLLTSTFVQSQGFYKVTFLKERGGQLFQFSSNHSAPLLPTESCFDNRVVHISSEGKVIVSYALLLYYDSLKRDVSFTITDSLIYDTLDYQAIVNRELRRFNFFNVELVNSPNLTSTLPVEDVWRYVSGFIPSIELPDSIWKNKKEPFLKVHGDVRIVAQASSGRYNAQITNPTFVRTNVNANIEVGGIPFQAGYLYTTEPTIGGHSINNYRLSFNSIQFNNAIKNKLDKRIASRQDTILKNRFNLTHQQLENIPVEVIELKQELSSPAFIRSLNANEKILQRGELDTTFKKSFRYRKAVEWQKQANDKRLRLNEIDSINKIIKKVESALVIDRNIDSYRLNNPRLYRRAVRKYGITDWKHSMLLSVQKFDIGTFDPQYTQLVLGGISLTGLNIEFNPSPIYTAFSWGLAAHSSVFPSNVIAQPASQSRNIYSGRIGFGTKGKTLLAMTYLRGRGHMDTAINTKERQVSENIVAGVDLTYRVLPNLELYAEYARSENRTEGERYQRHSAQKELVDFTDKQYSGAWFARATYSSNNSKSTSRMQALFQWVDPFYYSYGTPFLRQDNVRAEFKGDHTWFKRQFNASATYRRDRDNLYGFKQGTSISHTVVLISQIRLKKKPYFIIVYSPNIQAFYYESLKKQIRSRFVVKSLTSGYDFKRKEYVLSSQVTLTNQQNFPGQSDWPKLNTTQIAFNEVFTIIPSKWAFSGYYSSTIFGSGSDSSSTVSASLGIQKGLKNSELGIGLRYLEDRGLERRIVADASFKQQLGYGITMLFASECNFIKNYYKVNRQEKMLIGRLTIIKSF